MSQPLDEKSVGLSEVKTEIAMTLHTLQVTGDLVHYDAIDDTQLQTFSSDPRVIECLKKFGYKDVSFKLLAEHVGFTSQDMKLLDVFWEPTFNNSWIYLSPKLVCQDMGYYSVVNFHRDILVQKYRESEDWKEISSTSEMVITSENQNGEISPKLDDTQKRGRKAKHYAARGLSLKKMVMCAGKADHMRDYFLKLESLAILMREFMAGMLRYNAWLEKQITQKLISDQTKRITELEAQTKGLDQRGLLLKQFADSQFIKNPTGWLYIAATQLKVTVNHFKVGITDNLDTRLTAYNTYTSPATRVYFCDFIALHEPRAVEALSKIALFAYHLKSSSDSSSDSSRKIQDETYIISYETLHNKIVDICKKYCKIIKSANKSLDTYKEDVYRESFPVKKELSQKPLMIEMKITDGDRITTIPLDIANMSEEQKISTCKLIINNYVRTQKGHTNYDIGIDEKQEITPKIIIEWMDLKRFFTTATARGTKSKVQSSDWKPVIATVMHIAKNIEYRERKLKAKATK